MAVLFGDFVFDPARRQLRRHGSLLKVDPQQVDLLACFLDAPGVMLSKKELVDRVWGGRAIADSAVSVAIAKLRRVLGHAVGSQEIIENRYGRGYRFLLAVKNGVGEVDLAASLRPPPSAAVLPLVGRVGHLEQLDTAIVAAINESGSLHAIVGEPGIGKTRLAETSARRAELRGMRTAWARFLPTEGAPPLWSLAHALRELNSDGIADEALRLLEERWAEHAPKAERANVSELNLGFLVDGMASIHRAIDELTQAMFKLSQRQPLLVVLDDLQWADAASLRLLSYLAGELSRWPLMLIATVRSSADRRLEDARSRELLRLLSQRTCERIELMRLSESEVAEYISASFDDKLTPDSTPLAHAVHTRSQGNPFIMVELLRPWVGLTQPRPEQLRLSGLALDLVRQRLIALPERTRSVLGAAAVIGHDFDLGLLSHATERGADELLEALDESLANETVIASSHVNGAYAFDHELIREVLYTDLAASERCRLHGRIGEALLQRREAGLEVTHAELAHHLLAALPQGQVDVAIAHARSAAAAASRMAAHADARALLQRALDSLTFWVKPDPETLTALLLELAMVERVMGDGVYVEHLEQGVALARQHRFGSLLTVAGKLLSLSPGLLAQADAFSVLEAAADVLPETDLKRHAIVAAHLAWTPPNCLSARKVDELLRKATALARESNDPDALATVRDAQLFFSAGPKTEAVAEAIASEIERELKANPQTTRSYRALSTATFRWLMAMRHGDKPALARAIETRAQALAKVHNSELDWHHERMLVVARMNHGDFTGVAPELERLRQLAKRRRLQAWPAIWARDFSTLLLWTGDVSPLAERMRPALALSSAESPTTLARKINCMAEFGFLDDARAALTQISSDSLYDLPHDRDYLAVTCQLAVATAAIGSREHCLALYELLKPHAELYCADISFHCDGSVSHFLGLLAKALSRPEAAVFHFTAACERNAQFELRACALKSQLELATLLLDAPAVRDAVRGQALLSQLRQESLTLGLLPLAQAVDRRTL